MLKGDRETANMLDKFFAFTVEDVGQTPVSETFFSKAWGEELTGVQKEVLELTERIKISKSPSPKTVYTQALKK